MPWALATSGRSSRRLSTRALVMPVRAGAAASYQRSARSSIASLAAPKAFALSSYQWSASSTCCGAPAGASSSMAAAAAQS